MVVISKNTILLPLFTQLIGVNASNIFCFLICIQLGRKQHKPPQLNMKFRFYSLIYPAERVRVCDFALITVVRRKSERSFSKHGFFSFFL